MAVIHGLEQDALLSIAWDDRWAFFSAFEQAVAIIEAQVTFLLLGVVAFVALRHEYRADLRLEEFQVRWLEVGGRQGRGAQCEDGENVAHQERKARAMRSACSRMNWPRSAMVAAGKRLEGPAMVTAPIACPCWSRMGAATQWMPSKCSPLSKA